MRRFILFLMLCLLAFPTQAQESTPEPNDPNALFDAAVMAYWRVEDDAALAGFDAVITARPDFAEAWAYRGALHRALGNYAAARDDFAQAVALDSQNATVLALRSRLWFNLGDERAALLDANRAIRLNPASGLAYASRAILYLSLDEGPKAIGDYNRAIDLAPDFAPFYNNRGLAHEFNNNLEAAIADYDEAARLDSQYVVPLENAAYALIGLGRWQEAIDRLSAALSLRPEDGALYYRRGQLYTVIGENDLARADFAQAEAMGFVLPGDSA